MEPKNKMKAENEDDDGDDDDDDPACFVSWLSHIVCCCISFRI